MLKKQIDLRLLIARLGSVLALTVATVAITPLCFFYLYEPEAPVDLKSRLKAIKK